MLLSAVSVLVVAQSSSEIPEGLTNNPVFLILRRTERDIIVDLAGCSCKVPVILIRFE